MEGSSAWVLESDWCNLVGQALCEPAVCPSCPDPVQVLHPQELSLLHHVHQIGPCFAPSSTVRIEGCRAAVPVVGATADARVQDLTPGPAFGVLGGLAPSPTARVNACHAARVPVSAKADARVQDLTPGPAIVGVLGGLAPSPTVRVNACHAGRVPVGAKADARVQDLTPGPAIGVLGGLAPSPTMRVEDCHAVRVPVVGAKADARVQDLTPGPAIGVLGGLAPSPTACVKACRADRVPVVGAKADARVQDLTPGPAIGVLGGLAPSPTTHEGFDAARFPVVGAMADARVQDLTPGPALGVLGGFVPNPPVGIEGFRAARLVGATADARVQDLTPGPAIGVLGVDPSPPLSLEVEAASSVPFAEEEIVRFVSSETRPLVEALCQAGLADRLPWQVWDEQRLLLAGSAAVVAGQAYWAHCLAPKGPRQLSTAPCNTSACALPADVQSFLQPIVPTTWRRQALTQQGPFLADDQVAASLKCLASFTQRSVIVLDPLMLQAAVAHESHSILTTFLAGVQQPFEVISAFCSHDHWVFVHWHVSLGTVEAWTSSTAKLHDADVAVAHCVFGRALGLHARSFRFHDAPARVESPNLCGPLGLVDLLCQLQGAEPWAFEHACDTAAWVLAAFVASLDRDGHVRQPVLLAGALHGAGAHPLLVQGLAATLRQKGVPAEAASDRAQSAICQLGAAAVQKAMTSAQPWKQLKALANQAKPVFQWILPSELQVHIEARLASGDGPSHRRAQRKARSVSGPLAPSSKEVQAPRPDQVEVPDGVFIQAKGGEALCALSLLEVGPQAEGVVLVTPAEALPYLALSSPVSKRALALLVLGDICVSGATAPVSQVRFQAQCVETSEPMLLTATMIQIGDVWVAKAVPTQVAPLDVVDSTLVRVACFKDQWPGVWRELIQAPVRAILSQCPQLRTCRALDCACPSWHGLSGPGEPEALLEVFGRQFLNENYKGASPSEAFVFNAILRIPSQLVAPLQAASGQAGLYFEPRGADLRAPSLQWTVVWLPRHSHAEALVKKQAHTEVAGLARVGERYGLRCLAAQARELHSKVRPDAEYIPREGAVTYHVGPWPFGSQRHTLAKTFRAISWPAIPQQPLPGGQGAGIWWVVQASERPGRSVIPTAQGEILIVEQKARVVEAPRVPTVVASKSALRRLSESRVEADPLDVSDPWQQYLDGKASGQSQALRGESSGSSGPRAQGVTQAEFQQLARRLEESVGTQVATQVSQAHRSFDGEGWFSSSKGRCPRARSAAGHPEHVCGPDAAHRGAPWSETPP